MIFALTMNACSGNRVRGSEVVNNFGKFSENIMGRCNPNSIYGPGGGAGDDRTWRLAA